MKRLLLLTLNTFSATGGIEKVCRVAGKALHEIMQEQDGEALVYSIYDTASEATQPYFPPEIFRGFDGKKINFVLSAIKKGRTMDAVILSHANLLSVGYFIKKIAPKTKLFLIAHGIEVWKPQAGYKNKMMKAVDLFLPVSAYTGKKLHQVFNIAAQKIKVLNNCLDPFLEKTSDPEKEKALKKSYGFNADDFILLTLTRIKFSEQYKGYDKVIEALADLQMRIPNLKYLVAGKYDAEEKARLDKIINHHHLNSSVVFTGYIKNEDVPTHFNISDLYIMPSTGEGFGIVFIEALFYGLPVIAGNVDGSVDALANGDFGRLVDPDNKDEIKSSVRELFEGRSTYLPDDQKLMERFGFYPYKKKWFDILYPKNSKAYGRQSQLSEKFT